MLNPASTMMRVWLVDTSAAFPELPLASTQNFTVVSSSRHSRIHRIVWKQNGTTTFWASRAQCVAYDPEGTASWLVFSGT